MSLSILWLISIIVFAVVALLQSRNRLFVYNIALSISLLFISSIYILDKYVLGLKIASVISNIFDNMFIGIFASYNLSTLDLKIIVWATSMLLFFLILYIFLLVLFISQFFGLYKYFWQNVVIYLSLKFKLKKIYFINFLSSALFIICGFVISTFFFTFIKPITNLEYGFISPLFKYLYGGVKL